MSSKQLPKISIVTVAFNCENVIEKTIQSVLAQTYPNIEYIIVDGASKDRTMQVVELYKDNIDIIVSEKDNCNYDGMNKGLRLATGDYIWFLHAGDLAASDTVLADAFGDAHKDDDFVYGKTVMIDNEGNRYGWYKEHPKAGTVTRKTFKNGMIICHQSMLPHRRIWEEYRWEKYKYVADLDWTLRILKKAKTYRDTGIEMAIYLKGGISTKHRKASLKERFKILREQFGLIPTLWQHFIFALQALRRGSIGD